MYGVSRTLSPDANRGQLATHHLECPQMIDEAFAEPQARTREPNGAPDELSMRFLELSLAGIALLAAVLLTIVR